jgi:hypothetical protein
MSWLNKVKDHVGSGITSESNLSGGRVSGTYTLSEAAKDALTSTELKRMLQAQQAVIMNSPTLYPNVPKTWTLRDKILMRLDMPDGYHIGFHHLDAVRLNDEKMAVFVVFDGKHCTLEDDAHLFPSDTLITQLRILRK